MSHVVHFVSHGGALCHMGCTVSHGGALCHIGVPYVTLYTVSQGVTLYCTVPHCVSPCLCKYTVKGISNFCGREKSSES